MLLILTPTHLIFMAMLRHGDGNDDGDDDDDGAWHERITNNFFEARG